MRGLRRALAPALLIGLLLSGCGGIVRLELPAVDVELQDPPTPGGASVVVDAHGGALAVLRQDLREPVSLNAVPRHVVDAFLIAEDRRFFHHRGVDLRSLTRAALINLAADEYEQGGSTITQQLVKTLYLPDAARTPETKLREILLARQLEERWSKARILEEYLNTIYFGQGAYGVEAAAHSYFRSTVSELELHEAALLAAIVRAPEAFAPARAPDAARTRRDDVLWRMGEAGLITVEERRAATARPIVVMPPPRRPATREPHVVDAVLRTLLADPRLGATREERANALYRGGLTIHATVDPDLQQVAREVLATHLGNESDPDAAIVVVDPHSGHVVAMAGTRSYDDLQFDLATQARRQPGSTFKVFVLAAAVAGGVGPADLFDGSQGDISTPWGIWEDVRNYDRRSYPAVTLEDATHRSINTAYARLGLGLGLERVTAMARAMGITSPVPPDDPQITIGGGSLSVTPVEMAGAIATLATEGVHHPTTVVARVEDAAGRSLLEPSTGVAAMTPATAWTTLSILTGVVEGGTGSRAAIDGWDVAGKTGTTSDHADAWFVGTTPALAAAVWVGHAEGRVPLHDVRGVRRVTGGSIPAAIFADLLERALDAHPPQRFAWPDGGVELARPGDAVDAGPPSDVPADHEDAGTGDDDTGTGNDDELGSGWTPLGDGEGDENAG